MATDPEMAAMKAQMEALQKKMQAKEKVCFCASGFIANSACRL